MDILLANSEVRRFTLSKPVSSDSLVALRTGISNAIGAGIREILIDVDGIGTLDSSTIAVLISIMRQSREREASVSLWAKRQSILDTLRVTALNKVFKIVSSEPVPLLPAPPLRRGQVA